MQALLECPESPNLPFDRHSLSAIHFITWGARVVALAGKLQHQLRLFQRQADYLGFPDEIDIASVLRVEYAIARMRSRGPGRQPETLPMPKRSCRYTCASCQFGDTEGPLHDLPIITPELDAAAGCKCPLALVLPNLGMSSGGAISRLIER